MGLSRFRPLLNYGKSVFGLVLGPWCSWRPADSGIVIARTRDLADFSHHHHRTWDLADFSLASDTAPHVNRTCLTHHSAPHHTTPHHTQHTTAHYITPHRATPPHHNNVHHSVPQHTTAPHSAPQCTTAHHSVLQCVTAPHSAQLSPLARPRRWPNDVASRAHPSTASLSQPSRRPPTSRHAPVVAVTRPPAGRRPGTGSCIVLHVAHVVGRRSRSP